MDVKWTPWVQVGTWFAHFAVSCSRDSMSFMCCWILFTCEVDMEYDVELDQWEQIERGVAQLPVSYSRCNMCLMLFWILFVKWKWMWSMMWSGPPMDVEFPNNQWAQISRTSYLSWLSSRSSCKGSWVQYPLPSQPGQGWLSLSPLCG